MTRDEARARVIFALDVDNLAGVKKWVSILNGHVGMFKVGKQLFTAYGPEIVRMIENSGASVFLDLKYHDIPNTVAMASLEAARLRVKLFNVHALGGYEMMARTMEALYREHTGRERSKVLAVTILTSSDEQTLREVGIELPIAEMVVRLAKLAQNAGLDGVVASPREVALVREACGPDFLIVTPGVRPLFSSTDDQKRITTPAEAIRAGSNYLVIGRPISAAADHLVA
ncbi:MAG: orotidine-5'-phosphate decarboxylase, partial [Deltaproteobacteria bacterium]